MYPIRHSPWALVQHTQLPHHENALIGDIAHAQVQRFAGTVLFPDDETVPIEGVVLRTAENHMVVKLSKGISQKRMVAEQKRIREKYPLFFDRPAGGR